MIYGLKYSNTAYHSLREVKEAVEEIVRDFMEKNGLDLVHELHRDRTPAVKEVDVKITLRPH